MQVPIELKTPRSQSARRLDATTIDLTKIGRDAVRPPLDQGYFQPPPDQRLEVVIKLTTKVAHARVRRPSDAVIEY